MRTSIGFIAAASTSSTLGAGSGSGSRNSPTSRDGAVRVEDGGSHRADTTIRRPMDDAAIAYDDQGLVPCVIQDWRSGEVLTLAYTNAEALAATRRTGELHLWSRSRDELWHKGATSGNTQAVRAIRYDCDGDALLALVEPAGPACHTGERTCFHRGELEPPAPHEVAARAGAHDRRRAPPTRPRAPTPPACSPTRRSSARRSRRRPRRSPAPRARRPTSAWPRRPPTCSTTSPCCSARRGLALADAEEVLRGRRR